MSNVPHLTTRNFKVWLAGHAAYRAQSKQLFEQLAEGILSRQGHAGKWRELRDAIIRNSR